MPDNHDHNAVVGDMNDEENEGQGQVPRLPRRTGPPD